MPHWIHVEHTRHGYWLEEAGDAVPSASLSGDRIADIIVIGGGFTGMWAAWQIRELEPGAEVVLLESDLCGRGPSGRNGGFCNAMWLSLPNMRERWGDAAALAVAQASRDAIAGVESFCRTQGVDAWFHRGGYMQVSTAPAHDGVWEEAVSACRALGAAAAVRPLGAGEVAARCGSPAFRGGAFYPDAATVQPARLALGLRDRLIQAGVRVFERTPVQGLRAEPGGVEARCSAGVVRAGKAAVAIGAAAKAPHGPLRRLLTVGSSHIVLTEPVPELLAEIGWTGGECITDSRSLIDYFRTTPDGRILFGWGGGRIALGARVRRRAEIDREAAARAGARLRHYFPGLAGHRLTHAWGGPVDISPTHLPVVVPLRGGKAFAAAGYTGNGVGPSHMVGRVLAALALDRRDEHSRLAIVDPTPRRVPPEPLHWLGGEAVRWGLLSREEAELAGRRPGAFSTALSRVPELIGFHIGR